MSELGIEYPRTHDPAPLLAEALRERRLGADDVFLDQLTGLSARLAELRSPAFYQEISVSETEAAAAVDAAGRVLSSGEDPSRRLRQV